MKRESSCRCAAARERSQFSSRTLNATYDPRSISHENNEDPRGAVAGKNDLEKDLPGR